MHSFRFPVASALLGLTVLLQTACEKSSNIRALIEQKANSSAESSQIVTTDGPYGGTGELNSGLLPGEQIGAFQVIKVAGIDDGVSFGAELSYS